MRWFIASFVLLLFLLSIFSFTSLAKTLEYTNKSGFLIGATTSFQNLPDVLALGINFSQQQQFKGPALGAINPRLPQVAGVSQTAADKQTRLFAILAISTGAFLAYYLITKNFTAHEKPLHQ